MIVFGTHELAAAYAKSAHKYLVYFHLPSEQNGDFATWWEEVKRNIPHLFLADDYNQAIGDEQGALVFDTHEEMTAAYDSIRGDDQRAGKYGVYAVTITPDGIENENT